MECLIHISGGLKLDYGARKYTSCFSCTPYGLKSIRYLERVVIKACCDEVTHYHTLLDSSILLHRISNIKMVALSLAL